MGKRRNKINVMPKESKTELKEVYSASQYQSDESRFSRLTDGNSPTLDLASFKRLMLYDVVKGTNILQTGNIGNYGITEVERALKNPSSAWKILVGISDQLMKVSPHYYRLNNLYTNMSVFNWGIDLYDTKDNLNINSLKKAYFNLASQLEKMSLKHEFYKIMKKLPYQDLFCGLWIEDQTDAFIQELDLEVCKLKQIQGGLFNFSIDLSAIQAKDLQSYPSYIQQAYLDYKDKKIDKEYIPDPSQQVCIKLNSQWIYPFPILIGLVRDIFDLDIYKKLKLQSARTDNFKAIMVEVPIDDKAVDKPLLTPDTIGVFAEINRESIGDDIGLIYNLGSKGEAISFKDSSNTRNNVLDSVGDVYDSAGVSKELYNGSSSGTAVTLSIENDSGFVYGVYRQLERWVNRYIKLKRFNKAGFKFSYYLLDSTIFNKDEVTKRYKDACTLGATVIDKWMASLGLTPSKVVGSYVLHKSIFDYQNNFVPLVSSYNTADPGRPTAESKGERLSDSGENTNDTDGNKDR